MVTELVQFVEQSDAVRFQLNELRNPGVRLKAQGIERVTFGCDETNTSRFECRDFLVQDTTRDQRACQANAELSVFASIDPDVGSSSDAPAGPNTRERAGRRGHTNIPLHREAARTLGPACIFDPMSGSGNHKKPPR